MIRPKPLKKGDTIALISPSSPTNEEKLNKAVLALENLGLRIIIGSSCLANHGFLSGTDDTRVYDINKMFTNTEVKGIFALRGGYGASRLLDKIDYNAIKDNPKIFIGYSDITALHIAFNQICDLITFHGPMPSTELCNKIDDYTLDFYKKSIFTDEPLGEIYNPSNKKFECIYKGESTGKLIGGNLSLICSTLGTKYEINTKGKILFIEEVDEAPYRIDRMLVQLNQSGKLKDVSGILLGEFTNCYATDSKNTLTLKEIFEEILVPNKKPIISNVVCGHCMPTMTLSFGATTYINAEKGIIKILD